MTYSISANLLSDIIQIKSIAFYERLIKSWSGYKHLELPVPPRKLKLIDIVCITQPITGAVQVSLKILGTAPLEDLKLLEQAI